MNKLFFHAFFACALVLVSAGTRADEAGASALFRQINVSTGTVIALGQPFNPAGLAVSVSDGVYSLRPGKFAGAKELLVMVSSDGRVSAMQFIYEKDLPFEDVVARYRTRFGAPHQMDGAAEDVGVYWEDGHTRFEILRPTASAQAVSSRLIEQ